MIEGVNECHYNFDGMTLAVYYKKGFDLPLIQIKVADAIDSANVHNAIETINFYSMDMAILKQKVKR